MFILLPSKPTSGKSSINLFWAEREGHKSVFLLIQSHQTAHCRTPLTEDTTNHVAHICTKNIFFWREDLIGVCAIILPKGSQPEGWGWVYANWLVGDTRKSPKTEPSEIAWNSPVTLCEPTSTNHTNTEILKLKKKKNCLLRNAQSASLKKLKKVWCKNSDTSQGVKKKKKTTNIAWNR